jgi:xanthine dehydrogenase accessory factor
MSPPTDDILEQAHHLRHAGEPFALATVVRVVRPASARPGSKALIRADGSIHGWVGGSCAQPSVAREALRALADGQPRLLCLVGQGGREPEPGEGLVVQPMTCHSGGTIEVYIEPFVAAPRLVIVGQSAVSDALAQLGAALRYEVVAVDAHATAEHFPTASQLLPSLAEAAALLTPQAYVVVATHGEYDEDALALALGSQAAYVALIASRRRAATLVDYLRGAGVPGEQIARLRAPAGLDIGAAEPGEIALSILAEIVQIRRRGSAAPAQQPEAEIALDSTPETAIDPVCGMTVEVATARHVAEYAGQRFYFCCPGCKRSFEKEPEQYLATVANNE